MDKRLVLGLLMEAKENRPEKNSLIEAIEKKFNELFESITPRQKLMLRSFPLQYVKKIPQEEGEWTSQLHIWAEECVPDILKLDPIFLAFKNSKHESVLMSFVIGATGTHTGIVRYDLLQSMLERDYSYQDEVKDKSGNVVCEDKNVLDETDINDQTLLDYLVDVAFGTGTYEGEEPDPTLQQILRNYLAVMEQINAQSEEVPVAKLVSEEPTEVEGEVVAVAGPEMASEEHAPEQSKETQEEDAAKKEVVVDELEAKKEILPG